MRDEPINIGQKFAKFSEHWSPEVIAAMNDYQLKLVRLQGEFVGHSHAGTDERLDLKHQAPSGPP